MLIQTLFVFTEFVFTLIYSDPRDLAAIWLLGLSVFPAENLITTYQHKWGDYISWFEQKAVAILLGLFRLDIQGFRSGPNSSRPAC
jgi:hypothetical protein